MRLQEIWIFVSNLKILGGLSEQKEKKEFQTFVEFEKSGGNEHRKLIDHNKRTIYFFIKKIFHFIFFHFIV